MALAPEAQAFEMMVIGAAEYPGRPVRCDPAFAIGSAARAWAAGDAGAAIARPGGNSLPRATCRRRSCRGSAGDGSAGSQPACCHASSAANNSMVLARSSRPAWRAVRRDGGSAAGRSASAATLTRWRLTSKSDTGRKAVRPARKPSALGFQPRPSAVTMPAPVMTTRRRNRGRSWGRERASVAVSGGAKNCCAFDLGQLVRAMVLGCKFVHALTEPEVHRIKQILPRGRSPQPLEDGGME